MAPVHRFLLMLLCFSFFESKYCFPQGAPAEACDSLLPRHAGTFPSPIEESPYVIIASDDIYTSNSPPIKVEIYGAPFKGFLVAAIDPDTGKRIGSWIKGKGTGTLPCAAITHTDDRLKKHVILIWQPPEDVRRGKVSFVATILYSKGLYYGGQIATIVKEPSQYYY